MRNYPLMAAISIVFTGNSDQYSCMIQPFHHQNHQTGLVDYQDLRDSVDFDEPTN